MVDLVLVLFLVFRNYEVRVYMAAMDDDIVVFAVAQIGRDFENIQPVAVIDFWVIEVDLNLITTVVAQIAVEVIEIVFPDQVKEKKVVSSESICNEHEVLVVVSN